MCAQRQTRLSLTGLVLLLLLGIGSLTGLLLYSTHSARHLALYMVGREMDLELIGEGNESLHAALDHFALAKWWDAYLAPILICLILMAAGCALGIQAYKGTRAEGPNRETSQQSTND